MFTGLIEHVGSVHAIVSSGDGSSQVVVDIGPLAADAQLGDSIAIDGCCLTITSLAGSVATFDAVPETLERTTLGKLRSGSRVNLERALLPGKRLGGHFVQGHIDGTAIVKKTVLGGRWAEWHFSLEDPTLAPQIVQKGSIAINGISLTVAGCGDDGTFWVALIPETLERTDLGEKLDGQRVNIETDILGKYVQAMLAGKKDRKAPKVEGQDSVITENWLLERGFE